MNRIRQIPRPAKQSPAPLAAPTDAGRIETAAVTGERGPWPFSLFAPLHYEANYSYPLLIWLHGPADDERQLKRIMPLLSMRNYVAVAPRGTAEVGTRSDAYCWSQAEAHETAAEQRVFDVITRAEERFHVAPRRIFLAGFDCGGTMAFRLAMNHPAVFAGVLSLGGRFPAGRNPLLNLDDVRGVPVFLACGRDSQKYPPDDVCRDLRLLHSAGMAICLRQYPCRQEISPQMLSDMDRWMMELVTESGSS